MRKTVKTRLSQERFRLLAGDSGNLLITSQSSASSRKLVWELNARVEPFPSGSTERRSAVTARRIQNYVSKSVLHSLVQSLRLGSTTSASSTTATMLPTQFIILATNIHTQRVARTTREFALTRNPSEATNALVVFFGNVAWISIVVQQRQAASPSGSASTRQSNRIISYFDFSVSRGRTKIERSRRPRLVVGREEMQKRQIIQSRAGFFEKGAGQTLDIIGTNLKSFA